MSKENEFEGFKLQAAAAYATLKVERCLETKHNLNWSKCPPDILEEVRDDVCNAIKKALEDFFK